MVMPALLWVAFWSWMMGSAACVGEPIAVHVKAAKRPLVRDLSSGD
jgi:hypothetical protein